MPTYRYAAITSGGLRQKGVMAALDEDELYRKLKSGDLDLVSCQLAESTTFAERYLQKVGDYELIHFFVHLEQLERAGIPLLEGLADISESLQGSRLRPIVATIRRDISEGAGISDALGRHPGLLGKVTISLIAAGEVTGNLAASFRQVIAHLKWSLGLRTRIKKAIRYPIFMGGMLVVIIGLMMTFVVPQLVGFLKMMSIDLPLPTRALIAVSDFTQTWWWMFPTVPVVIIVLFKTASSLSTDFNYFVDHIMLRMPVFGPVVRKFALSRFCHTFSIMFSSGINVLPALDSATQTLHNAVLERAMVQARIRIQEGATMADALAGTREMPPLVIKMLRIGESSGNLSEVLGQVNEFYDREVNETIDAMVAAIEPALTMVIGAMMGWIAVAVFMPLYDSFSKIR